MRLVNKLIILAICVGIPLAFSIFVLTGKTRDMLEMKILERHQELVEHISSDIDSFFGNFQKNIFSFLYNYETSGFDDEKLESYLSTLMVQFEDVKILTVMREDRSIPVQIQNPAEVSPSMLDSHVSSIDTEIITANKSISYSDIHRDDNTGALIVTISFPLPDGERVLGVELELATIQRKIAAREFDRNESAFVVDDKGQLLADSRKDAPAVLADVSDLDIVKTMSKQGGTGVISYSNPDGVAMVGAYSALQSQEGWGVIVQQPERDAYSAAIWMKSFSLIAIFVSVSLAFVFGFVIARSIIIPMNKLVTGAEEIGRGELSHTVEVKGGGEVSFLAGAFNRMSRSLLDREQAIQRINESAKRVSSIIDREALSRTTLDLLDQIEESNFKAVVMPAARNGRNVIYASSGGRGVENAALPGPIEDAMLQAVSVRETIIITDAATGLPVTMLPAIVVPMVFEDKDKGAIIMAGRKDGAAFSQTDIHLFGIVASSAAISVQNIELLEDTVEKTRMEEELKTAELVQKTLFPEKAPDIPGLDLAGFIQSAEETGGDWYGFVHEPENKRVAILIADVTGHGVPAALVTATTHSFFKTLEVFRSYRNKEELDEKPAAAKAAHSAFDPLSPDFMMRCLNQIILESTNGRLVMTLFASVYYYDTCRMVYASAGHNQPVMFREEGMPTKKKRKDGKPPKKVGMLKAKGVRLGDLKDVEFKEHEMTLIPGDMIIWYTDGIVECTDPKGEEYGIKRLKKLLKKNAKNEPAEVRKNILEETGGFFADMPHKDDITFVVGRVYEHPVQQEQSDNEDVEQAAAGESGDAAVAEENSHVTLPAAAVEEKSALVVSETKSFSRQAAWFLQRHVQEVDHFRSTAEVMDNVNGKQYDLCVLPIGGDVDQVALAYNLKQWNPDAKFIFVCSASFDGIVPILIEYELPLVIIKADYEEILMHVEVTAEKLFNSNFWGLTPYLERGTEIHEIRPGNTSTRTRESAPLFTFVENLGFNSRTANKIMSITEELLMNAMYDAPRDKNGKYKYAELDRREKVILEPHETPCLTYGSDGDYLGISVSDPFGGLTRHTVLKYLDKCLFKKDKQIDDKPGGAGLGLYKMYRLADHMIFNVRENKCTEVLCLMRHKTGVKFKKTKIQSIGFFERRG